MQSLLELLNISTEEAIIGIVIILMASILILLILRGFWCWFFKTTEISYCLEEISDKISSQHKSQIEFYKQQLEMQKRQLELYDKLINNEKTDKDIEESAEANIIY